jgi:uncharacterized protein YeaO (DUF488 family)
MLKQASVSDLIMDRVSRSRKTYVVITMRRYPRFVNRELRDEYTPEMSPEPSLHEDWLTAKRKYDDHDGAFARVHYDKRFTISEKGLEHLKRLSELSKKKDVYFICSCRVGQRCHREMVLLLAKKWFKAKTDKVTHEYPEFEKRIASPTASKKIVRREPSEKPNKVSRKKPIQLRGKRHVATKPTLRPSSHV